MTQTTHDESATSDTQATKKQRKKQAKREAKTMLKLEQARQDVQQAEQKVARAEARLEAARAHLRNMEARAAQMHTSHPGVDSQPQYESSTPNAGLDGQQGTSSSTGSTDETSALASQVTARPPAEGRTDVAGDIAQEQAGAVSQSDSEPFTLSEDDETSTEQPGDEAYQASSDPFIISEDDEATT